MVIYIPEVDDIVVKDCGDVLLWELVRGVGDEHARLADGAVSYHHRLDRLRRLQLRHFDLMCVATRFRLSLPISLSGNVLLNAYLGRKHGDLEGSDVISRTLW